MLRIIEAVVLGHSPLFCSSRFASRISFSTTTCSMTWSYSLSTSWLFTYVERSRFSSSSSVRIDCSLSRIGCSFGSSGIRGRGESVMVAVGLRGVYQVKLVVRCSRYARGLETLQGAKTVHSGEAADVRGPAYRYHHEMRGWQSHDSQSATLRSAYLTKSS
jgi:hypothetical protein